MDQGIQNFLNNLNFSKHQKSVSGYLKLPAGECYQKAGIALLTVSSGAAMLRLVETEIMSSPYLLLPILSSLLLLLPASVPAQKEKYNWYFGAGAGLQFHTAPPTPTAGALNTNEGCSAISDPCGELLFYTDGMTVYNKSHKPMPNGQGLFGHVSSTQSALIVQRPGSLKQFYVFTSDADGGYRGLRYSVVDMSLQYGMGDVVEKNILLNAYSCEKLAGIRHANGKDVWVVTHDWNSNQFRTYLVTAAGVSNIQVMSAAGAYIGGWKGNAIGMLRSSLSGTLLGCAVEGELCRLSLFRFDPASGQVSNELRFNFMGRPYSLEFSPDESKMYAGGASPSNIYQFNLNLSDSLAIAKSGALIYSSSSSILYGSMQLGPDKKIYMARGGVNWLDVIEYPDSAGIKCGYKAKAVDLVNYSNYGLANFINRYPTPVLQPFSVAVNCLEARFTSPKSNGLVLGSVVQWDFGDPDAPDNKSALSDPVHLYSKPGVYKVRLVMNYRCTNDTFLQTVIIPPFLHRPAEIAGPTVIQSGETAVIGCSITGSYRWSTGHSTQSITVPAECRHYSVFIKDGAGCTYTAERTMRAEPMPSVSISQERIDEFQIRLRASGGSRYQWTPAEGLDCPSCADPNAHYTGTMRYCVKISDDKNCSISQCVDLVKSAAYVPNSFTPNGDNRNDVFLPVLTEVHDYRIRIFDRWGEKLFESALPEQGWNGSFRGAVCEEGVYIYQISYKDNELRKAHTLSGHVTLIH